MSQSHQIGELACLSILSTFFSARRHMKLWRNFINNMQSFDLKKYEKYKERVKNASQIVYSHIGKKKKYYLCIYIFFLTYYKYTIYKMINIKKKVDPPLFIIYIYNKFIK